MLLRTRSKPLLLIQCLFVGTIFGPAIYYIFLSAKRLLYLIILASYENGLLIIKLNAQNNVVGYFMPDPDLAEIAILKFVAPWFGGAAGAALFLLLTFSRKGGDETPTTALTRRRSQSTPVLSRNDPA